jgi:hypothetical protein
LGDPACGVPRGLILAQSRIQLSRILPVVPTVPIEAQFGPVRTLVSALGTARGRIAGAPQTSSAHQGPVLPGLLLGAIEPQIPR